MNEMTTKQYPVGQEAWIHARRVFGEQGLNLSACPSITEKELAQVSDWVFATRTFRYDLYQFESWVNELSAEQVEDYLAFGVSGHGIQSWAFHWYEVAGAFAGLVQLPWGGAYGDSEKEAKRIHTAFARVAELRDAAGKARAAGAIPAGCRFVLAGGLSAQRVGWVGATGRVGKSGGSALWNFRYGYEEALRSIEAGPGNFEEYITNISGDTAEND